jgi:hypothetical protein
MAPFDALYGRRCRTLLNWSEAGERTLFGPDLVKDAEEEEVQVIRENLKMAQMRQKSYHVLTVKIRQPSLEFTFGVGISFIPCPLVLTPVV